MKKPSDASEKVKTAVILAAGDGQRIRSEKSAAQIKPLLKVGGLHLLERSILTLKASGIEHYRVVVGYMQDTLIKRMKGLKSLHGLDIRYVVCEDFHKGNGVSLAAGVDALEEPFLVVMADHVTVADTVTRFLEKAEKYPNRPQLATDPNSEGIFDLCDATKVRTEKDRIVAIAKDLSDYNGIDMGLFYFPDGYGRKIREQVDAGAHSVTEIVRSIVDKECFFSAVINDAVWQDVDTLEMAREAERRILRSLVKSNDGPISRNLNRPISRFMSLHFARWRIHPNVITTFVTLITLASAAMLTSIQYRWIVLGGVIFQLASILDGCDGEVARVTFRNTRFGALYDLLSDNFRYVVFFACLGVGAYRASGLEIYIWADVLLVLLFIFFSTYKARYGFRGQDHSAYLTVPATVEAWSRKNPSFWDRFIIPLKVLIKQDVIAFLVLFFCLVNLAPVMFWLGLVGIALMSVSLVRAIGKESAANGQRMGSPIIFIFFLVGLGILGFLISRMPIGDITQAFHSMGFHIFWVFAVAPLWFLANAMALSSLVRHRVGFPNLLYNQLVGEAMNTIVPLAGIGGEPFKIKHLSRWLPLGEASQAIVLDRLIHAVSGLVYSSALFILSTTIVPLSEDLKLTFILVGSMLAVLALALIGVSLSKAPSQVTIFLLKRISPLDALRKQRLPKNMFLSCLGYKLLGRVINLIEVYLILRLLGLAATPGRIVVIAAFIAASSLLINIIPQGLGVAEAGITGAFALIGLSAPLGLTFGLIRRVRIIFWALMGIALFLPMQFFRSVIRPAKLGIK